MLPPHLQQCPALFLEDSLLTDDKNKSPTSPFLNMAELLTMTMIMTTLWLYYIHKLIYIQKLSPCDTYGLPHRN